jgi:hypothetical protein
MASAMSRSRQIWVERADVLPDTLALTRRGALGFATLVAFLFQVFVADTHWHWNGLDVARTGSTVAGLSSGVTAKVDAKNSGALDICPLCQALSAGGRYLEADAPAPLLPLAILACLWFLAARAAPQLHRAYAWRSRAPPVSNR